MLESLFSATISLEYRNGLGHKTKGHYIHHFGDV